MIKQTGIWFWPLVMAVLSAAGLLSALLADGVWDWVSVLTLGAVSATVGPMRVGQMRLADHDQIQLTILHRFVGDMRLTKAPRG